MVDSNIKLKIDSDAFDDHTFSLFLLNIDYNTLAQGFPVWHLESGSGRRKEVCSRVVN